MKLNMSFISVVGSWCSDLGLEVTNRPNVYLICLPPVWRWHMSNYNVISHSWAKVKSVLCIIVDVFMVLQSSLITFEEGETWFRLSPAMSSLTTAGFGRTAQCLISCFTPPSLSSPLSLAPHRLLLLPLLRLSRACRQSLRFGTVLLQPTLQLLLQNPLFFHWIPAGMNGWWRGARFNFFLLLLLEDRAENGFLVLLTKWPVVSKKNVSSANIDQPQLKWITLIIWIQCNILLGNPGFWHSSSWHQLSTESPLQIELIPPWHRLPLMTLVPQQGNECCHTTKTAQDQPEERRKELEASTWHQNAPRLNLIGHQAYMDTKPDPILGRCFLGQRTSTWTPGPSVFHENIVL